MRMEPDYKYERVILVDDNHIDNIIHEKIILSSCYAKQVISFESAIKAIDFLKKVDLSNQDETVIIFLDLRMPEMDGYGFLHQLKTLQNLPPAKLKIHVLSSSLDPLDRRKIEKSQLTESFISKPLTAEILKQL